MSRKMTPRLMLCRLGMRGLGICGFGIQGLGLFGLGIAGMAGPLGCSTNHVEPVDARIFIPPPLPHVAGADSTKTDSAQASTAGDMEPAPVRLESPKSATVLPDPTIPIPAPFNTIKPLEELSTTPTTQPAPVGEMPGAQPAAAVQTPLQEPVADLQSNIGQGNIAQSNAGQNTGGLGVYMTLGGVIAQVNDVPIYANQVLTPLKKEFSAKAREMDPEAFRRFASDEIFLQLKERIDDERYFATAYHALTEDDRKLAEAHAMYDRHNKVIAAGGSVEQARQLAADQGLDFDESIRKDYRELVFVIYQRRMIEPLIQVSADNMRQYYRQNLDKQYREKEQAQFRVIEIDPAKSKDATIARQRIDNLRERAAKGEDFDVMACTENDNDVLKSMHGCPTGSGQWLGRNVYAISAVDDAIWNLQPGQITPVIEAGGKLYIAKLEAKRGGVTHPFEDQAVQADIYAKLRQQQFNALWQQRKDESAVEAMVNADSRRMQVAVDMAMQKYAQVQVAAGR